MSDELRIAALLGQYPIRAIDAATEALAEAARFDKAFYQPDPDLLEAWVRSIARLNLSVDDCLPAVQAHYEERAERITLADLIRGARLVRKDRAEREKAQQALALNGPRPASPDHRAAIMKQLRARFGKTGDVDVIARLDPPVTSLDDAWRRLNQSEPEHWDKSRVAKAMRGWHDQQKDLASV
jgi:hypothetical protein